ncbi:MAG: glycosyltransferase [Candidatus Nanoarchaeia archaeon]
MKTSNKRKRTKQLTVTGIYWDFWPLMTFINKKYPDSKYISFYEPWLKGNIDKNKIIKFNEKRGSGILLPLKLFSRTAKVFRTIKKEKIEVVNSQHDDANLSVAPVMFIYKKIIKRKTPKFNLWVRNNPLELHKKGLHGKYALFVYKYIYPMADKIFVQCEENAEAISKKFPKLKDKIVLFPNVFDIKNNILLSKEPLNKNEEEIFNKKSFVFINIGRLTEQKGQWFLIRAFKEVHNAHPDTKLVIIGDGELYDSLLKLINSCDLKDSVFILRKSNYTPFKYLAKSDCFVFPSLWEGFGNLLVESLSVNLPVISADCVAGPRKVLCPEINYKQKIKYPYCGKYGILIKPFKRELILESPEKVLLTEEELILKRTMTKIIIDRNLRKKYSNCLSRAKEFDIDYVLKKHGALLD